MADDIIVIEGLEDVTEMLSYASEVVSGIAQVRALSAGGNVIARELELRTPVKKEETGGNSLDRGVLRETVSVEVTLDTRVRGGYALVGFWKYAYVANWLEYGHRLLSHGKKAIRRVIGFVDPRPFMRPTAEVSANKAVDVYIDTLRSELKKAGLPTKDEVAA